MAHFPLTDFLLKLGDADAGRLVRADPGKLAIKYGISAEHAAGYIRLQLGSAPQGIEARRAETGTGSVHESPSGAAGAPNHRVPMGTSNLSLGDEG